MSGIAGMVYAGSRTIDQSTVKKLGGPLAIRGADGGAWIDSSAGFAYSLCAGTENPQQTFARRGPYAIVADARIDGRDELLSRFEPECRNTLRDAGDAELILSCYQRWGATFLDQLIGDFSFAIWDGAERRLLCARDQFGVNPLFYAASPDFLLFSNTIDCLIAFPGISKDLDRLAIADFLLFGRYLEPNATAFSDIRRLPAGHCLEWQGGVVHVRRYWTLPVGEPIRFTREGEYIDGFQHYLARAVGDRLHPDRTAVLMSGGLDSTMVAAVASVRGPVKSFAIVYDRLVPDPERRYAQIAADSFGIPLDCLAADDYPLFERASGAHQTTAEPVDEPVPAVFTDHLARVKSYSQVALTGVGGDQLLFPSPDFAMGLLKSGQLSELAGGLFQFMRLWRRIPTVGFRSGILRALGASSQSEEKFPAWLNPDLVKDLDLSQRWKDAQEPPKDSPHPDRPEAYMQLSDPGWSRILESYDAGITRIPLEVRHPLFDLRLVRYCLGIPPIPWFVDKTLARVAMRDRLPDEVRLRPKAFASDAVAARLASATASDSWHPVPELAQFVDRTQVPPLNAVGKTSEPPYRPFLLNQWLSQLTKNCGK